MQVRRTLYALALVALFLGGAASTASAQTITTVSIVEKAGVTTANYPVTLSLIFKKGDVATNVTARVNSVNANTQTDVKRRYDDNSVKHALVSFLIPSLAAGSTATVEIVNGGTNYNTGYMTKAQLLATDFDARMNVTPSGGSLTSITARNLLNGIANPEYWVQGDICTEFLVRDFAVNIANQLNVQFYVRKYPGWNGFRVDTVVENVWGNYTGNIIYNFNLDLGYASPATVFAKTNFTHTYCSRWRKVFWLGQEPPAVEIRYSLPYMISTGLLPKYDTNLVVPESVRASRYAGWLNSGHDIMDNGIIYTNMGDVAGREDIGLNPTWSARYLSSMDNRMKEITLNCGDLSGSIPIHFREHDAARTASYRHIITIDDRPTIWLGNWGYVYQYAQDKLPMPIGPTTSEWGPDMAHQPHLGYVPYLATGDFYYLEEMYFWSAWNLASGNWEYRQGNKGILHGQTRAQAWGFRTVADAASMAPDAHTLEKNYFANKINNMIAYYTTRYVNGNFPSIHYWKDQYTAEFPNGNFDANVACMTSPWMDDFMLISMAHAKDIGFATGPIVDWLGVSIINRFHHPDYNWYRGADYQIPTRLSNGTGGTIPIPTWFALNDAFAPQPGPTSFPADDYPYSYRYIARAALSHVTHLTDGQTTWNWLDTHVTNKSALNSDPTWAMLPNLSSPDTVAPAAVTNLAAGSPTSSTITLTWTAPGDDSTTGRATTYDIRRSTSAITTGNWGSATQVTGEPAPASAGTSQSMTITGLSASTTYYFAIKTLDEVPNTSGLSNVVSAATITAVTPTVQFAAATSSGAESVTAVSLPVNLNVASGSTVTVGYAVTGGSATGSGTDFTLSSGTLTFSPSVTTQNISLTVVNDATAEANETIVVTLSGPTNATLGATTTHTYTIVDNDAASIPTVQFDVTGASGAESVTTVNVGVSLSNSYTNTVTVDYAVTGGTAVLATDYTLPPAGSFVQALKRSSGLLVGGSLSSQFTGLTGSSVVLTSVKDALLNGAGNSRYMNYGISTLVTGDSGQTMLVGFDLSALAGATINRAELRIRSTQGNSTMQWAAIKSRDWVEGTKNNGYPGASPASPGVCFSHPAGLYTAASGASGWGTAGNAMFSTTGDGQDLYAWNTFTSIPIGAGFPVTNLTTLVQEWVNGTKPNYGLAINIGNHSSHLSEQSSDYQPVLFVDYTLSNRVSFTPGQTTKTIAITVINDTTAEPKEIITLTLSNPVNAVLGSRTTYDYSIIDNDNAAPTVNAGPDQTIVLPGDARLDASSYDDGLPDPPAGLTTTWTKVSGPGTVTFAEPGKIDTTAGFSASGTYVLQVTVNDGLLQASDTLTVTVQPMPTLQFSATSSSGSESTSPANLPVTLSAATPHPVVFNFASTGGSAILNTDYFLPPITSTRIAFKRDVGLVQGGALSSEFTGLNAGNVIPVAVKDARLNNAGDPRYYNYGTTLQATGSASGAYMALSFDLTRYAGATIYKAELRLRATAGTSVMQLAGLRRSWAEGNKNGAFPGSNPSASGICWAHPNGTYTAAGGTAGWGAAGNAMLDLTGNGADLHAWTSFRSAPGGTAWVVADVTSLVADWVSGAKANYGMLVNVGDHTVYLSEIDSDYQPVLFVDCLPSNNQLIIEPNTTAKNIPISVADDTANEPDETFQITMSSPVNSVLGANTTHTYTIQANDTPPGGGTQTLWLQNGVLPDTSYAGCEDNWMHSYDPATNNGTNGWGNGIGYYAGTKRSLIKFNVSGVPAGSTVTSAKIRIKLSKIEANRTVEAYQVLRAWTQLASTWNNYAAGLTWTSAGCGGSGTDRAGSAAGSVAATTASQGGWIEIPLSASLVQGWVNGTITNNGVLLKDTTESGAEIRFYPENHPTAADRPMMVIEYTTASTNVTFQNGVLPDASYAGCEDNWMHSSAATTNYGTNDWGNGMGAYAGTKRSLIKFNVSTIPAAATVTSAKLQLKITVADASKTVEAFQVLRAWTKLNSTWNNYTTGTAWTSAGCGGSGTDRAASASGSFNVTTSSPGTWVEITLPNSLVQGWVNGSITNNGLLLKATNETSGETRFAAENNTTAADRPKLVIEYTGG